MKLLIFSGIVSGYKGLVAGGMNLTIETNEMNPEDTAKLVGLHRKAIKVMIEQGEIIENDLGFTEKEFEEFTNKQFDEFDARQSKSPSKRLRNVLWVLFKQDGGDIVDGNKFKEWYDKKLEEIITHYKGKIEDE